MKTVPPATFSPAEIQTVNAALIAAARTDMLAFAVLMFPLLHNRKPLIAAGYIDLICLLLERNDAGTFKNIVFNLPPRHLKSILISVLYPAWLLGRNPGTKIICISYSDDLAHHLAGQMRTVMKSRRFAKVFPKTRIKRIAIDHITTTAGGYRYSTAVHSDITGFGADYIILDDPMQPDEATSEKVKNDIRTWYQSSVLTRREEGNNSRTILVMHRLAPDDLSATLKETSDFHLSLPLVAEKEEKFVARETGRWILRRQPGEPLNPRRMNAEDIEKLRTSLAGHVFDSQYQQRPTAGGSGMLSINHFKRFDPVNPPEFDFRVHSWDVGATVSGNASVLTSWGIRTPQGQPPHAFLLEVQRLKLEIPELKQAILAANKRDRPALVVVDATGVGLGLAQELNRISRRFVGATDGHEQLERSDGAGLKPNMPKIQRFGFAALVVGDGRVHIPTTAAWLDTFLYEIAAFPNITDKDQVDSFSQIIGNLERVIHLAKIWKDRD